jgi:uncharacterized protein (DUF362 family)
MNPLVEESTEVERDSGGPPGPLVAVERLAPRYPEAAPYHPSTAYPELDRRIPTGREPNLVYDAVRGTLFRLGLDAANFDTPHWNPLSALIRPGDNVLLKPNLIRQSHGKFGNQWQQIVTHGSVIRAVADYVLLALQGQGTITIADGPQTDSDFEAITGQTGLREICRFYESLLGFPLRLVDLRNEHWIERGGIIVDRKKLEGDPRGTTYVDLGDRSWFADARRSGPFYGAFYDLEETNRNHSGGRHLYAFSRTALEADVVINLPKLKTHKKAGVTASLKNLVGLNTNKNLLPHYTFGSPATGGDQFPREGMAQRVENGLVLRMKRLILERRPAARFLASRAKSLAYRVFGETEAVVRSGNWYGNDTIWRMVLDLNKILFYARPTGEIEDTRRRRYLTLVDAVIAGEGNGPVYASAFPAGMILAGVNPVAVDAVAARIIGFDWSKIPAIRQGFAPGRLPLSDCEWRDIRIASNDPALTREALDDGMMIYEFAPHFGWKGHIELAPRLARAASA